MHPPWWMWITYSVLAVMLGTVLAVPAGAATSDAWITTKIKLALLTTDGVSGTAIKVDTVAGRVTLYGKVHSAESKRRPRPSHGKLMVCKACATCCRWWPQSTRTRCRCLMTTSSGGSNRRYWLILR